MIKSSIIVADDHVSFRRCLIRIIQEDPSLYVVKEVGNGVDLLRLLEATIPDAVILDISMPILSGLEAAAVIKKLYPDLKVMILTMHSEKEYFNKAIEIGVDGYLNKREIDNLNYAINTVLQGKKYLTPLSI
jgi:DNA-binding NarL/FixJ family response regulator